MNHESTPLTDVPRWLYALRLLPCSLPGKNRLGRLLMRLSGLRGAARVRAQGLSFTMPSVEEPVCQGLIRDGVYEPETAEALRRHLGTSGTLVDVGANIGVFSLLAAHRWCPAGRVLALEASPQIHAWLAGNVRENPAANLTVVHAAVTSRSGETVSFFNAPESKFGMGSLTNRFDSAAQSVSTITLDDAVAAAGIRQVDVIKVDVEGHELGVFQGAMRALHQEKPPVIVFEFTDWGETRDDGSKAGDAQRFLISQGYVLQRLSEYLKSGPKPGPVLEHGGADLIAWKECR